MIYLLLRDRVSRSQFLLRTGGALGTLLFGGALASRAGAQEAASSDSFSKNITGVYVPEGTRHLVTSNKPEEISWGFLPNRDAEPILTVESGDVVTIEQISHEGILDDQGDPVEFFESPGSRRRCSLTCMPPRLPWSPPDRSSSRLEGAQCSAYCTVWMGR